jgi:ATP-dependent Clp protease ATP-binding subunit ClpA
MTRMLLSVLDKATLRLGDNTTVNFERTMIFLTSNLGTQAMRKEIRPDFGFESLLPPQRRDVARKLESIGKNAVRRKFSPEFVNRIDAVITYLPLDNTSLAAIVDQQIADLERHIQVRLMDRAFELEVSDEARRFLLEKGTSEEYGARELKRTILRKLTQPLAAMLTEGLIEPGDVVRAELSGDGEWLSLVVVD